MLHKNKKFKLNIGRNLRQPQRLVAVLGILVACLLAWHWSRGNDVALPKNDSSAASSIVAGNQAVAGSMPAQSTTAPKNPAASGASASTDLVSPYGTYSSDQTPSSARQTEVSICKTSIGAACTIHFTSGSEVKSLPTKTADSNGSVFWSWTPHQVGLTAGSWRVSMVATLNGQTKTSSDVNLLQIP